MVQKLRERSASESGFTLVELLVVMLILGLLAAIAVPSFLTQRDKAKDADAKALVRTAQTAMETYATDRGGSFTGATRAALIGIEPTLREADLSGAEDGDALTVTPNDGGDGYTVTVASKNTPNTFSIVRASNGTVSYGCSAEGSDGCPTGGDWGGDS
jgi:type IV pilus assembly protein PilA